MGERMTGADAAWLHMDRPTNRMVVNMVAWFEQEPDWDAVREVLRTRWVDAYPRFRQRVKEPLLPLAPVAVPEWEDDPEFDFEDHIREAKLPSPGDEQTLHAYVEEHITDPLPGHRALWEVHLLSGYQKGGALLFRANHALGDGFALMHAVLALADPDENRGEQGPPALIDPPVDRESNLSGIESVRHYIADGITTGMGLLRGNLALSRKMAARVTALAKLAVVPKGRKTVLRQKLGTRKRVTWTRPVPVDALRSRAKDSGATINDVLLATIAGALGRYLRQHGSEVPDVGFMLPFNLRPLDQPMPRTLGNQFGLGYPTVPVRPMPDDERIAAVHEQ